MAEEAQPEPVFIRKRKQKTSRQRSPSPSAEAAAAAAAADSQPVVSALDADEIELRQFMRLSKKRGGISLERLSALPSSSSPSSLPSAATTTSTPAGNSLAASGKLTGSNFQSESNTVDVDGHMMAYIQTEYLKRHNLHSTDASSSSTPSASADPLQQLYQVPPEFRLEKVQAQEGDLTTSTAMLTSIPEVDLGITARLSNIEKTEKAKLLLAESKRQQVSLSLSLSSSSSSSLPLSSSSQVLGQHLTPRFYRPPARNARPEETLQSAKINARKSEADVAREAEGKRVRLQNSIVHGSAGPATDEVVMGRFKSRIRGK